MDRSGHVGHILVDGDRLDELAAPRRTVHVRRLRRELNIVVARLRDTLAAIAIAILFILSTAAGTVSGGMVRRVLQWSGIASSSLPGILLLELTGFCTGVALNFALFMLLLRVVAHIKPDDSR